jgi:hypothetical protein
MGERTVADDRGGPTPGRIEGTSEPVDDPLGRFISEHCSFGPSFSVSVEDLWQRWVKSPYREGCWSASGQRANFGHILRESGIPVKDFHIREQESGRYVPAFYGLKLRPLAEIEAEKAAEAEPWRK